ncbi:Para-aminobenzoate synthase component 1 [Cedecea neteri]|uniref:Para-aminobenzoate synthase component 1 n=1 Tax=Cedecea neteri TaxID=158822 RepID=A0A2X3KYW8_9ENTR|nr:Para-aminobenzoate synthase component 1 [Cedecea neteri]
MLLHSGFADHPHNRFDIMVASPLATLVTRGQQTVIERDGLSSRHGECPLDLLQQMLDSFDLTTTANDDIPFCGGALGLFSYDLGRRFENIPATAEQDLTTPDMAVGIYDWALIADHHLQRLTLVLPGRY